MLHPSFKKGSILKQNMLEVLRDYPYKFFELEYISYGDGIIIGFEIEITNTNIIQITPGILKQEGDIYISTNVLQINQFLENHYVYLVVEKNETPDGMNCIVKVEQYEEPQENKIELFRYTKNAELHKFKDISEVFSNPINRINQIYAKRSIEGGTTLCNYYFKLFANQVLKCQNVKMEDIAFAYQCLNGIQNTAILFQYFGDDISNQVVVEIMKKKIESFGKELSVLDKEPEKKERPKQLIVS